MATTFGIITPDNTTSKAGDLAEATGSGISPTRNQSTQPNTDSSINTVSNIINTTTAINDSVFSRGDVAQVMFDVLKNTSINGVYPTVTGGNIDYPLSTEFKASDEWAKQNWYSQPMSTYTNTAPANLDSTNTAVAIGKAINNSGIVSGDAGQNPQKSNFDQAASKAVALADSNVQVANSKAKPLVDSNAEVANSRARPVSDSDTRVANSKSTPLTDSDREVANPKSNALSRRRANEQAMDANGVTPLYVKSADGKAAMVVYLQDSHTISVDPDATIGDTIKDSMSGEEITPSEYFLSGGGGSDTSFPFQITVKSGANPTYKVSYNSSIINGTNGGPFNINGLNVDKGITQERFIIAEATVTDDPFKISDSGFIIREVGADDTNEVVIDSERQTKLRLLIGKITIEPQGTGKLLRPWQAVTTSFQTTMSFYNGAIVFTLQSAPTHQSRV